MELTLVILAAGAGSRFGGDKPLAAVGPNGESLFEYSVRDAINAGFNHVVFVVNSSQNTDKFFERLSIYKGRLKISFAAQNNVDGIDSKVVTSINRTKPWGTGHAILTCRAFVESPFVVINADDYYGVSNFQLIGDFLKHNIATPDTAALPGYLLKNTLSKSGGVNRGICKVDDNGYLQSILECTNISVNLGGVSSDIPPDTCDHDGGYNLSLNTQVSMNLWGFYPEFFAPLKTAFNHFLETTPDIETDEFYIPAAVNFLIHSGFIRVKVFPSNELWSGVTYATDIASVRQHVKNLPAI